MELSVTILGYVGNNIASMPQGDGTKFKVALFLFISKWFVLLT